MADFGVRSFNTMKSKVKRYSIPVIAIVRKPTICLEEVEEWKELRKGRGRRLIK